MSDASSPHPSPWRSPRRWLAVGFVAVILAFVFRYVINPYGDQAYLEIPHGNHTHYVPRDRDPNVSLDAFPTTPPGPNEQILPDGRVVPR